MRKSGRLREYGVDSAYFLAGSALFALSVNMFSVPGNIAQGGVTGVAIVLHYLYSRLPVGTMIFVLNIPLFLIAFKRLGRVFIIKTLIATALLSVLIDAASPFVPPYHGDRLLAALYGGVLSGTGLAIVFLRGGTTGGTDIVAKLINRRSPHLSVGRIFLLSDGFVVALSALVFWSLESALYSLVFIFVSSRVVDALLYGADRGRLMMIVSRRGGDIARDILRKMERGVTTLEGEGAYTGERQSVLLCAVRLPEVARLHSIAAEIDPGAFLVALDAGEIVGEGFKKRE